MSWFKRKPQPRFEARFELGSEHRTITGRAKDAVAAQELFERRQAEMFPDDLYPLVNVQRVP